jgi:hypothetical protein
MPRLGQGKTIEAKLRIAAEVAEAITALKQVRKELLDTGRAAGSAGKGAGRGAGQAAADETTEVVSQVKKRTAAEREAAATKRQQDKEELARQRELAKERKRTADQEEAARRKQQQAADRQRQLDEAARRRTERQATYNKAALAPQLNDVFVGLTTGQSPVQLALQQGPQITQIYGGVTNTFRALTSVLTPLRIGLGLAAAGFATLAVNIASGYRESSQINKELALTGNIAGTSLGQINGLASSISAATGQSIGFVRDALREVLQLSGQTDTTLGATARAASALAKLNGQSAAEAVKGFENQADGITQWSVKANKAYNFLTAAQVAYIRSLEQQGRIAEATRFVNDELADAMQRRGVGAIGLIERAWNAAGAALSGFLDKLKQIGRDETAEERLARLQRQLETVDGRLALRARGLLRDGRSEDLDIADRERLQEAIRAASRAVEGPRIQAAALRQEQERIKRESREYQQALANGETAAAQLSLANLTAALDRRRELIEANHARELLSASDQAIKLNAIDQERAKDELEALRAQRRAQEKVKGDTPVDRLNDQAALKQLDVQIVNAESRFDAAMAEGRKLVDAEISRLNSEIRRRQAENIADDIEQATEPLERARLAGQAATATAKLELQQLERQFEVRKRALESTPGADELLRLDQRVLDEARRSLAELTRRAELQELFRQSGDALEGLATKRTQLNNLVAEGALTEEEAEGQLNASRRAAIPLLLRLIELQRERAKTADEQSQVSKEQEEVRKLKQEIKRLEITARETGKGAIATLFNDVFTGAKSGKEALLDMVRSFGRALVNLINQNLAAKLFKQFEGAGDSGNGQGGWFAQLIRAWVGSGAGASSSSSHDWQDAEVWHRGGQVGSARALMRAVSPLVFAGAQVLHSGGLAAADLGLRRGEVPAILEEGEEVLTERDPRHIRNFRSGPLIGNLSISVNVSGAEEADLDEARARVLAEGMRQVVAQYVAEQMRQGGLFTKR